MASDIEAALKLFSVGFSSGQRPKSSTLIPTSSWATSLSSLHQWNAMLKYCYSVPVQCTGSVLEIFLFSGSIHCLARNHSPRGCLSNTKPATYTVASLLQQRIQPYSLVRDFGNIIMSVAISCSGTRW